MAVSPLHFPDIRFDSGTCRPNSSPEAERHCAEMVDVRQMVVAVVVVLRPLGDGMFSVASPCDGMAALAAFHR
jgi:hypothetical protein